MIEYCQAMFIYLCAGVFGCLALVSLAMFVNAQMRRFVACLRRAGRLNAALALIAVGAMVVYGGSKPTPPTPDPDPDVYTVTFDANGGSVGETSREVEEDNAVGELPEPAWDGFTFDGWWTTKSGGSKVPASTKVTSDVTYYAHWKNSSGDTPGGDTPGGDTPGGDTPGGDTPGGDTPGGDTPGGGTPGGDTPGGDTPGGDTPGGDTPGGDTPGGGGSGSGDDPTPDLEVYGLYSAVAGAAPTLAASEYNGYLLDDAGNTKGTIQVKVGKPNAKTGLAAIKASVVIGSAKKSLKAAGSGKAKLSSDGPTEVELVGGEKCVIALGADGLAGSYGVYAIDGARNFFTSKDKVEQAEADAELGKWLGPVIVMWDGGSATVTVAKKGKAKVKGTLVNGAKVSASAVLLVGEEWCCVPVVAPKANLAFSLWLSRDGMKAVAEGLGDDVAVGRAGALGANAKFHVDKTAALWSPIQGEVLAEYLPDGISVRQDGKKWVLPKAGKIAFKSGEVDESRKGDNAAALKLTYKVADSSFKGSFKVYAIVGGKLKATTVNVVGVMVNGVGYGTATVKGKGSVPVTIE